MLSMHASVICWRLRLNASLKPQLFLHLGVYLLHTAASGCILTLWYRRYIARD